MYIGLAIVAIVISLVLVVGGHELGHALAAQWCGVKVKSIVFGLGRSFLSWRDKKGREWIWALWPLGGSVNLLNSRVTAITNNDYSECFDKKPLWNRVIILLSGSMANILIAWLALSGYFLLGYQQNTPVILSVQPMSIAAQAQLSSGDKFISVAGHVTLSWQDVMMQLLTHFGQPKVAVLIKKSSGVSVNTTINLTYFQKSSACHSLMGCVGFSPNLSKQHMQRMPGVSVIPAMEQASHRLASLAHFYLQMLKKILSGQIPFFLLLGPMGFFKAMMTSLVQGIAVFLYFMAHLNLVVAIVNMLPFPSLDGGSIVYALIEKVRGQPMSLALETLLHRLATIFLCVLFIQLLLNDFSYF